MENPEDVMMELAVLEKSPESTPISASLEDYLTYVAKTGNALFAWNKIKPLFKKKLEIVIQEFHDTSPTDDLPKQPNVDVFKFDQMKQRIFEQLESYSGIPFTVQRLCELMVQPKGHYKRTDKFMRGLEKIMLVVSTIDPIPSTGDSDTSQDSEDSRATLTLSQEPELEMVNPIMRQRMLEQEGPCDSADAFFTSQAVTVEEVPSLDSAGSSKSNGLEEINTAEAEAEGQEEEQEVENKSGGEENMDIDTECTSSQARLQVEPDYVMMNIEPELGDGVSTSEAGDKQNEVPTEVAEEAGDLHSSSEQPQSRPEPPETNSEAEPVEASLEDEKAEETAGGENVQSSEERTATDSVVTEDSGAADSSDEVTPKTVETVEAVQTSDITTENVTCSDTTTSSQVPTTPSNPTNPPDTADNSPDQSLQ